MLEGGQNLNFARASDRLASRLERGDRRDWCTVVVIQGRCALNEAVEGNSVLDWTRFAVSANGNRNRNPACPRFGDSWYGSVKTNGWSRFDQLSRLHGSQRRICPLSLLTSLRIAGSSQKSRTAFSKTYELAKAKGDRSAAAGALLGMVRTGNSLEAFAESDRWFSLLVEPGDASARDWQGQGGRQFARKDYKSAGDSYVQAAQSPYLWNDWRQASITYSLIDSGAEDDALKAARACIQNGAGKKDSDTLLASAHNTAAGVLNKRGVYEEALSHAREAVAIDLPARARYSGKALGPNHAAAASILNNLLWTKGESRLGCEPLPARGIDRRVREWSRRSGGGSRSR
jgi:tetratricopeptide (TPR) repeat protein